MIRETARATTHRMRAWRGPSHGVLCRPTSTLASNSRRIRSTWRTHTHRKVSLVCFVFCFLSSLFFLFSFGCLVSFLCFVFCFLAPRFVFVFVLFLFLFLFSGGHWTSTQWTDASTRTNDDNDAEKNPRGARKKHTSVRWRIGRRRTNCGATASPFQLTQQQARRNAVSAASANAAQAARALDGWSKRPDGKRRVVSARASRE